MNEIKILLATLLLLAACLPGGQRLTPLPALLQPQPDALNLEKPRNVQLDRGVG